MCEKESFEDEKKDFSRCEWGIGIKDELGGG